MAQRDADKEIDATLSSADPREDPPPDPIAGKEEWTEEEALEADETRRQNEGGRIFAQQAPYLQLPEQPGREGREEDLQGTDMHP